MKSVKGTKTEKNLLAAFAGESQARNRYTYFASKAKKEGYEQIAAVFQETADNEKEHAKRFFSFLEGGMVDITATFPAGVVGTTVENLKAAADGEKEEHAEIYPAAADIAEQEGSRISPPCSGSSRRLRSTTRSATGCWRKTSRTGRYSRRTSRRSGSAGTAGTSPRETKRRRNAPPVSTKRPSSSCSATTSRPGNTEKKRHHPMPLFLCNATVIFL